MRIRRLLVVLVVHEKGRELAGASCYQLWNVTICLVSSGIRVKTGRMRNWLKLIHKNEAKLKARIFASRQNV